ncbi:hypothetical protein M9H77_03864 [Catharanthus roseus]|uniref:Uncharacterized protein n=1 Tax=Catharanthus roseus TaxID=4058 RepID=A0ACC0CCJ0_CATRO|nr:hypothetical protein M9H77_03864 [Catharanthus roseus]
MVHLSCHEFCGLARRIGILIPEEIYVHEMAYDENELKTLIRSKGLGIYFDQRVERIALCVTSLPYEGVFRATCLVGLLLIWIQLTEGVVPLEGWAKRGLLAKRDTF